MEIPTQNSATWLSTSKKILYFFYNNIRVFFGRILHSTFRPKSYAQTIKIGDESDFFNSMNFLFISISFYLTVCSIFILMAPNHAKLQLNTNDFLHFMRIMVETFIIGLTCYFLLFVLTKRRITFTNFLHSWFHISAILVFYGVFNLLMAPIFFPPLGENSQYFLDIIAESGEAGR